MPEYRYGVNKVIAYLKNGDIFRDVHIAWGREIVKVGDGSLIPFDASDVIDVENEYDSDEIPYIEPESLKDLLGLRFLAGSGNDIAE
jgi:hypothetical protein